MRHLLNVLSGELSARALTKTKGIYDGKNPYPSAIKVSRELFQADCARNCVHAELEIEGSGITYQHGDHVGIWPTNPNLEVNRMLCVLGLHNKQDTVINIDSLDPALAKVPFPVPTTYGTVLRHYIDICAVAGRQMLGVLSKFAPHPEAEVFLKNLNTDKDDYSNIVTNGCFKLGEVLQLAAGNNIKLDPTPENTTVWGIPFDIIVSSIPRLQPRFYSISSSPKLHPNAIHVTAVVLQYESIANQHSGPRPVHGIATNFLLNVKYASEGKQASQMSLPMYSLEGPRGAHQEEREQKGEYIYRAPIHVRRSTFRLPANPKIPVIMIGPGTVSRFLI